MSELVLQDHEWNIIRIVIILQGIFPPVPCSSSMYQLENKSSCVLNYGRLKADRNRL